MITSSTDGVGTKIELAKLHKKYEYIGIDLVEKYCEYAQQRIGGLYKTEVNE